MKLVCIAVLALLVGAVPADAATRKPLKTKNGTLKVDFALDPFGVKLLAAGVEPPTPIAPAVAEELVHYTFPVRTARVNGKGTKATIRTRGGQTLREEFVVRTITNLTGKIRHGRLVMLADAGGGSVPVKGIPFLRGRGTAKRTKNGFTFTVKKLRLTDFAATDTNSQFETTTFHAGEVVGSGKFVVRK